jgi:type II secretory pathway component PulM
VLVVELALVAVHMAILVPLEERIRQWDHSKKERKSAARLVNSIMECVRTKV